MSDDDNYTIEDEDEDEAPPDAEAEESGDGSAAGSMGAIATVVLGLVTIAGAAFCATVQADFQQGAPDNTTFFVTALTLPLSIAGALLTVVGVCVLIFRLPLARRGD